jgi:hypothetical protein
MVYINTEQIVKGGGCLIIGSSQLTPCGSLNEGKSFTGKLSQINIWNRVLDEYDVTKLYRTCDVYLGDVLPWKRSLIDKYVGGNNVTSPSEACQSNCEYVHPREPRGKILSLVSRYQKKYPWVRVCWNLFRKSKFNMAGFLST